MKKGTHKKKRIDLKSILVVGAVSVVLLLAVGFLLKIFLTDSGPRKKLQISSVTLMKPPEQKDKPPEPPPEAPKPQQTQQMDAPTQQQMDTPQNNQPADNAPAGPLGLDAEGGAGSDGFGLAGRKGGRSIIGGGGGGGGSGMSLMAKYGWYTKKVQDELWGKIKKALDEEGGIPKGKHKAVVWLQLDPRGSVVQFKIVNSSGNDKVDEALRKQLPAMRFSQPLPDGMPKGMTIRVSSQG